MKRKREYDEVMTTKRMKFSFISQCKELLQDLKNHPWSWPFKTPIKPEEWNLDANYYFAVVKFPMDLSRIEEKLDKNEYDNVESFANDVRKIWKNSKMFNLEEKLKKMVDTLDCIFEEGIAKIKLY